MKQQGYFVTFFSVSDLIEMSDVNHVNILYAITLTLLSQATQAQIEISKDIEKSLLEWFTTTQTETVTKDLKSEIGVGGDFLKIITAKLKNEATFREEIKKTYERKVSELARKAEEIASIIQAATGKQVLVVIDDLHKLDLSLVEDIYKYNINSLFLPKFQIIYTIPISAIRNSELLPILQSVVPRIHFMAVCKFFKPGDSRKPDGVPKEELIKLFKEAPLLATLYESLAEAYQQRYHSQQERQLTIKAYEKAIALQTKLGLKADLASSLEKLGNLYFEFKDEVKLAHDCYQQALLIYQEIGDRFGEANTLRAIGDVLQFLKRSDEALQRYETALSFYRDIGDRLGEANILQEFGKLQENPQQSLEYLQQAQNPLHPNWRYLQPKS